MKKVHLFLVVFITAMCSCSQSQSGDHSENPSTDTTEVAPAPIEQVAPTEEEPIVQEEPEEPEEPIDEALKERGWKFLKQYSDLPMDAPLDDYWPPTDPNCQRYVEDAGFDKSVWSAALYGSEVRESEWSGQMYMYVVFFKKGKPKKYYDFYGEGKRNRGL